MSAFLGPIHYWLYRKIQLQEELIEELAELSEKKHWEEISKDGLRERTVRKELRPLNELIDITNIHGWLQERIRDVEGRYALLVTALLKADPSRITALEEEAFRFGRAHRLPESSDLSDAYRALEDSLLNGMPCDRVNVLTEQSDACCSWEQTEDIHAEYWNAVGGEPENYYRLREKLMEGMLDGSGIRVRSEDQTHYSLTRSA